MSKTITNIFNLEYYPEEIENNIIQNNRHTIIDNINTLNTLIEEALITNNNRALHLGIINEKIILKIKNKIKNLPKDKEDYLKEYSYDLVINRSEIRHLKDDKVRLSSIDIYRYVERLPSIIIDFDEVSYSKQKEEGLRFEKKFSDGTYYCVILVSNKKHTLTVKTIYMKKSDFEAQKKKHISTE